MQFFSNMKSGLGRDNQSPHSWLKYLIILINYFDLVLSWSDSD